MIKLGIYGYECTKSANFDHFKIIPFSTSYDEVLGLSSDQNKYNLTSFLEINDENTINIPSFIFDLTGVLSFIDQKDIVIQNQLNDEEEYNNLNENYPRYINDGIRPNGIGKTIMGDAFVIDSRRLFIDRALTKLSDTSDPNNECFRQAFFKTIEVFRAKRTYIDVSYYLLFSALESLSRSVLNGYTSTNCATPITNYLQSLNFDIYQDKRDELNKAVSTYAHLRNSLFHNGKFYKEVNFNGNIVRLKLMEFYSNLEILLPLVMMKYIEFDDGHINWNSWLDRQMFKVPDRGSVNPTPLGGQGQQWYC